MDCDREILLSIIRLNRMCVPPNEALDMNESSHQSIGYLLTDEQKDLESKSYS